MNTYLFNNCNNYNTKTNNLLEMGGSSSLLVEQGTRMGGVFSLGDRFIPCRPEESQFQGVQKFYHEEMLLLSR